MVYLSSFSNKLPSINYPQSTTLNQLPATKHLTTSSAHYTTKLTSHNTICTSHLPRIYNFPLHLLHPSLLSLPSSSTSPLLPQPLLVDYFIHPSIHPFLCTIPVAFSIPYSSLYYVCILALCIRPVVLCTLHAI